MGLPVVWHATDMLLATTHPWGTCSTDDASLMRAIPFGGFTYGARTAKNSPVCHYWRAKNIDVYGWHCSDGRHGNICMVDSMDSCVGSTRPTPGTLYSVQILQGGRMCDMTCFASPVGCSPGSSACAATAAPDAMPCCSQQTDTCAATGAGLCCVRQPGSGNQCMFVLAMVAVVTLHESGCVTTECCWLMSM